MAATRAMLERAVKDMRLHLGSIDRVSIGVAQRLYQRMMRSCEKVASASGMPLDNVIGQVEREAVRRGLLLGVPGRDF